MTLRTPHDLLVQTASGLTEQWRRYFDAVTSAVNDSVSQISSFTHASRLINAGAGLQGGGSLAADRYVGLYKAVDSVANLPAGGNTMGDWAYATDACNVGEGAGTGTGCAVTWSGGAWRIPGVSSAVTA